MALQTTNSTLPLLSHSFFNFWLILVNASTITNTGYKMSAELRDAQCTIDDLDEGVDTSFQPAFDEDTDDDTGECKQIERLPHLRDSEEIQLLCSNVLVKDPTGLALREFLSDPEAGEVYMNETYIKALCDWKLATGTIDYDVLEIPRVISDTVRLEQYGLEVQRYAKRLETHAFNLIDIVAAVFEKLNILDGQALAVRNLLNYAVDSCPELLLLGAVQLEVVPHVTSASPSGMSY
jgi:hypothetical protein